MRVGVYAMSENGGRWTVFVVIALIAFTGVLLLAERSNDKEDVTDKRAWVLGDYDIRINTTIPEERGEWNYIEYPDGSIERSDAEAFVEERFPTYEWDKVSFSELIDGRGTYHFYNETNDVSIIVGKYFVRIDLGENPYLLSPQQAAELTLPDSTVRDIAMDFLTQHKLLPQEKYSLKVGYVNVTDGYGNRATVEYKCILQKTVDSHVVEGEQRIMVSISPAGEVKKCSIYWPPQEEVKVMQVREVISASEALEVLLNTSSPMIFSGQQVLEITDISLIYYSSGPYQKGVYITPVWRFVFNGLSSLHIDINAITGEPIS